MANQERIDFNVRVTDGIKICAQDGATNDDVGVAMPQMDMLKARRS